LEAGFVLEDISHRALNHYAELERMPAERQRNVIDPWELLRDLPLGQEVRRADIGLRSRKRRLGNTPIDGRIFRNARHELVRMI
jgi:hypothetical protein